MKLMRIGAPGAEIPCLLDQDGVARDISALVGDIGPDALPGLAKVLAGVDPSALPRVTVDGARIGAPILPPRNIYCIGLNYSDHAEEAGMAIPEAPILFNKSASTFCGPNDPILHVPRMSKLDWEVELAMVIGRETPLSGLDRDQALDHVFGYTLANDVSERVWQIDCGGQWAKGKSFPNFCPTGPVLVTGEALGDPQGLDMWLEVNGVRMQSGNTRTMIFDCATIVAHLSQFLRLEPGDLILTGTPPGVGMGKRPQVFLTPGDVVTLGIDGLGQQRQVVTSV